ncbi:MAG: hypothetical protein CMJ83_03075 [Planctomycetes bacterium]|nr:hypothetical protein [Planctomycetota bacterium]
MFLPLRPEEGAHHFPKATFALVGLCVLTFLVTRFGVFEETRELCLAYGEFNPVQWFTSAVMHADWWHLIGNMFFLFAFGIVVEGLAGTPIFLVLIGAATAMKGCVVQLLMLNFEWNPEQLEAWAALGFNNPPMPVALGASGFIFAIMLAAMVWSPKNKIICLWIWSFMYLGTFRLPVTVFVGLYLVINVWDGLTEETVGFVVTTPWLHLIGGAAGGLLAWVFMVTGIVDTGGWHLFGPKARRGDGW